MGWATPQYSKRQVDKAGQVLARAKRGDRSVEPAELIRALDVLNNWRASHGFPLNTIQNSLRKKARELDETYPVAQRLKRVPSIVGKLSRFPTMQLSRMQDIGGCRCVVGSVDEVRQLAARLRNSRMRHELMHETDYILNPKVSGYRSYHMVYKYQSERNKTFNGLQIEVQLRSNYQHAWATTVETTDTFLGTSLKSGEEQSEWASFFRLVSSAFALIEGTPVVPGTPQSLPELVAQIRPLIDRLDVFGRLDAYCDALKATETPESTRHRYHLLILRPETGELSVRGFESYHKAYDAYTQAEQAERTREDGRQSDVVLVATDSMKALRQSYPNYFLDTSLFMCVLLDLYSMASEVTICPWPIQLRAQG